MLKSFVSLKFHVIICECSVIEEESDNCSIRVYIDLSHLTENIAFFLIILWNPAYYTGIMLNALSYQLYSSICWHITTRLLISLYWLSTKFAILQTNFKFTVAQLHHCTWNSVVLTDLTIDWRISFVVLKSFGRIANDVVVREDSSSLTSCTSTISNGVLKSIIRVFARMLSSSLKIFPKILNSVLWHWLMFVFSSQMPSSEQLLKASPSVHNVYGCTINAITAYQLIHQAQNISVRL